ncbi:MAG: hypothetical protein ABIL70_03490 [candidate division WOR-3 bacterium]
MKTEIDIFKFLSFMTILFLTLNCPKRPVVKTTKIEVVYLASLYKDIQNEIPLLAGVKDAKGLKVGYLNYDTPFMPQIFQRLGFYQLLNEFALDYLITNYPVYGYNFFSVPLNLGYGIKNYEGIRFGIFSKNKDSLTIAEQTKLALVKERCDVLWVVDNKTLSFPPALISFIIKERILQDTTAKRLEIKPDSVAVHRIKNFYRLLNSTLSKKVSLEGKNLTDFVFSEILRKKGANVVLYPEGTIKNEIIKDSVSIEEFLKNVACEKKFKIHELNKEEVKKIALDNKYLIYGTVKKKNTACLPDADGEYLFDLLFY